MKLRLVEREVQASRVTAKGEYMVQNKYRAWIARKARPQPKASEIACEKGVRRDPAPKGSHDGELDRFGSLGCWGEIPGALPESVIRLNGPRADHIRNHRTDRHHAGGRSGSEKTGDQAWDRLLHEATTSREGEGEVHVPGQVTVEASWQRRSERDRCQYFRMDVGDSRSASPRADRGEPEAVGRFGQEAEDAFDLTDQSQVSAYRPSAAASAATWMATAGQAATCSAAKEAASSESGERQAGGTGESGERQSGEDVGSNRPAGDSGAENGIGSWSENATDQTQKAKSRPLTEEQKAVAEEVLAQKAKDLLKEAERGTATLKREKESTASGSGAKKVPKYLEHLTDDQRAHLFRTELSSEREAEAIEWEKELASVRGRKNSRILRRRQKRFKRHCPRKRLRTASNCRSICPSFRTRGKTRSRT